MVNLSKWNSLPEQYKKMILIDINREINQTNGDFICSEPLKRHLVNRGICNGNEPVCKKDLLKLIG